MTSRKKRLLIPAGAVLFLAALALASTSCSRAITNRNPAGEIFPSVEGQTLSGEEVILPDDYSGNPVLLLVGYVMEAQFDIDRWLLGLEQAGTPIPVIEVPTIDGMLPGLYAGFIDEGMRKGIPSEAWASVVTIYGDADKITQLTGTENPRNARVLLIDEEGRIIWFHDRGYLPAKLIELDKIIQGWNEQ